MKNILLCILNVLLLVAGQTLFKMGTKGRVIDSAVSMIKLLFSPMVLSGLVLYAFTTILWLYILSKMPISRAYPIQALAYPIMLVLAGVIFRESISVTRWLGAILIFAGVVLVAK